MAKNNTKRDRLLIELTSIERRLRKLYGDTYRAAVEIKAVRKAIEEGQEFTWDGNPAAAKQLQSLLDTMGQQTNAYLRNATSKVWTEGEEGVHNALAAVFATTKKSEEEIERITEKAREDLRKRGASGHNYFNEKRGGLTISDRVWNISDTARNEIETIVQNGILEGKNPDQIAKSVQPYLREPHKLFRRVRNKETGELELSQAAKKYKPGRGVYRSAYKNAMRLARTEVTAAYRRAEWETYQNNPLITGFRIELSNNHTTLVKGVPVPFHDICDEMVGVYPKTFKWTGWHPQCRCRMIPVFISKADFKDRMKALAAGKLKDWKPKKATTDMPENFKKWIKDNSDRIAAAGGASQASQGGNETPLRKIEDEVAAGIQYDPKGAKEISITGWRKKTSGEGTAGTFYYHDKSEYLQDYRDDYNKHVLKFKRALIITDPNVEVFEGLPLEYLFAKWNPDYPLVQVANRLGMETGQLIDKIVTRQAIAKGYDALIMGEMEIIDLRSHYAFKAATQTQTIRNWKGLPYWMQDNQGTINSILNLTTATAAAAKPFVLNRKNITDLKNKGWRINLGIDADSMSEEEMVEIYKKIMGEFDLQEYGNEIEDALNKQGIKITKKSFVIRGKTAVIAQSSSDEKTVIHRGIHYDPSTGQRNVSHQLLKIKKELQGKGLSRELLKAMYKQYKKAEIKDIILSANITVGGYAWAKYGFHVSREEINMVDLTDRTSYLKFKGATEKYFRENPTAESFPMRIIADMPGGKEMLLESNWDGFLDLTDRAAVKTFENYLFNRR